MKKFVSRKTVLTLLILLVVGGSLAAAFYFYQKYQKIRTSPEELAREEVLSATTAISRFMELPTDEEPTLATVTDNEKLKDQDFFKNAQNDDKVLIYAKAHKAILYRPSTNKVIEFAPLTFGEETQTDSSDAQAEPIEVAIYNGTATAGLTTEYESKLSGVTGLAIVTKSSAAKSDYTRAIVVDLTGGHQDAAKQIAELLGGDVSDKLPDGEVRPEADILVIAGR